MSKDKNLIVIFFLAFSFLFASGSIYFSSQKEVFIQKLKPTVLGVTTSEPVSISSSSSVLIQSSSSSSTNSQVKSSSSSKSAVISQSKSSPSIIENTPINRGVWEDQQNAYLN